DAQPITGSSVPGVPFMLTIGERLVSLLAMLLKDWLQGNPARQTELIPFLVGVEEPSAPAPGDPKGRILSLVEERIQRRFHPRLSRTFPEGHVAGFKALEAARAILRAREASACLVCGVDSYLNAPRLSWLSEAMRLKTADNSDGLIPGEAAAC